MQPAQARPGFDMGGVMISDYASRISHQPAAVKPQNVAAT
jgi:hypothetical protein